MSYAARSAAAHASAVGGNYTNTPYSNNVPPNHSNPVHGNYQNTNVPNNSIYGHPSPQQGQGQSQQQVHQQQRLSQPQVHPQVTPAVNYSSASSVATMSTLGNASVTAGIRSPHQPQLQPNNQQPPNTSPYQQQQHNTVNVNPVQQYQNTMPYSNNTSLSASQFNTQTIEKEQTRLVAAATSRINQASFQLKRVMDDDSLLSDPPTQTQVSSLLGQVLDFAVNILIELTSFDLTPKHYYEIHMMVVNEACLAPLTEFFVDLGGYDASRITSVSELYRIVQYCPKVLPRLYLQIAAGVAMIKNGFCEGDEQRDLWDELLDAVKCVQQPVRGLFLRSYLLQVTREYLPPKLSAPLPVSTEATVSGAVSSGPNSGVEDSYQFVLRNFGEMTRLWVRIQHMAGPQSTREQKKRKEKERNHVRILVGTNLVRLSQLDGLTVEDYGSVILPRIIAVMLSCRDTLAQAYLMDCTIQVFPDEFHVETLETFLEAIPRMREKVNVRTILSAMMDRLAIYGTPPLVGAGASHPDDVLSVAGDNTAVNGGNSSDGFTSLFRIDAFSKFEACISAIHASREKTGKGVHGGMPLKETIRLHSCLLKFAKTCYPHDLGLVNRCLGGCADALAVRQAKNEGVMDDDSVRELETLLQIPQSNGLNDTGSSNTPDLANPLGVLELDRYPDLLSQLPWENRRVVATNLLQAVSDSAIDTVQTVERLYSVITPLLRDAPSGNGIPPPPAVNPKSVLFQEEQALVSKLVHHFQPLDPDDTDAKFQMYATARGYLQHGGKFRLVHTLLPLVFGITPLIHRVRGLEFDQEEDTTPVSANVSVTAVVEEPTNPVVVEGVETPKEAVSNSVEEVTEGVEAVQIADEPTENTSEVTAVDETVDPVEEAVNETVEPTNVNVIENNANATPDVTEPEEEEAALFPPEQEDDQQEDAETMPTSRFQKQMTCRKLFVFLQKTIALLAPHHPELTLKLYLETAIAADNCAALTLRNNPHLYQTPNATHNAKQLSLQKQKCDFTALSYELVSQAFVLYEDEIMSDSKAQQRVITQMVSTLLTCTTFGKSDYEGLITKTTQYAAKLLKKPDQCKMVTLCSHLFFTGTGPEDENAYRNPKRVLECLQRSLKIADTCMMSSSQNIHLFVEILDHYVFYFERDNPVITHKFVTGLIALINEHIDDAKDFSDGSIKAQAHYRQILQYINGKKKGRDTSARFSAIIC
mmetsp:Transcript_3333/g.3693  ORF Transcript_3333/g.3693 Transcript_3333/m.3693 type:complete len:1210 (-) Transcript_3333:510-4139(-)